MSIIKIFVCEGCEKEYRKFDNETIMSLLVLRQIIAISRLVAIMYIWGKLRLFAVRCASGLDKAITEFFKNQKIRDDHD